MTVLCFSDTLQFHVTPASLHRTLQKVPQTRSGSKYASVLNSWATDDQLKLTTNSAMENTADQFHMFQENVVDLYTFFMSPACFWFSDQLLGKKELLQTQNSLAVLDVPNFLLQTQESSHCKAHKMLVLPDFVAVRGKEAQGSNSKPYCMGEAPLPPRFLWLPWQGTVGVQDLEYGRAEKQEVGLVREGCVRALLRFLKLEVPFLPVS